MKRKRNPADELIRTLHRNLLTDPSPDNIQALETAWKRLGVNPFGPKGWQSLFISNEISRVYDMKKGELVHWLEHNDPNGDYRGILKEEAFEIALRQMLES